MSTEVDPEGVMSRVMLDAADFRNARVLEVGAGDGRLTFQYGAVPKSIVGIDIKESEIRLAIQDRRRAGFLPEVQFLCASATALPFSANEFEIVLLASSL